MIAALAMYPFAEWANSYDALWRRIRIGLGGAPDVLDRSIGLRDSWTHPGLLLGQTCGLPLVRTLSSAVRVVGAFHPAVPGASGVHYRAVVVATRSGVPADLGDQVAAVNERDSLSGWLSLTQCLHGSPDTTQPVVFTGSHVESLRALQRGDATVASIDAVTYAHVGRAEPDLVDGLHQIGWGPAVPSLPLIASRSIGDDRLDELRHAIADAVADPAMAADLDVLLIRGFSPLEIGDYEDAIIPLVTTSA